MPLQGLGNDLDFKDMSGKNFSRGQFFKVRDLALPTRLLCKTRVIATLYMWIEGLHQESDFMTGK